MGSGGGGAWGLKYKFLDNFNADLKRKDYSF